MSVIYYKLLNWGCSIKYSSVRTKKYIFYNKTFWGFYFRLYAVGGRDGSSCLKTVECFDPHTNKWLHCSPMSKRRGGVGVATCNGFLYAVGGHEAPASNPSCCRFDCAERYSIFFISCYTFDLMWLTPFTMIVYKCVFCRNVFLKFG